MDTLVLLLGPTASGKSAIAMHLAERFPIEIISVDSAQVYRGLDIGTAKPGPVERQTVTHHLIDIVDPVQSYSAARFVIDAHAAIADVRARGRIPLLVGGSMLYARALVGGLHRLPAADAAIRARLDDEARRVGWPALHARLASVDPCSAARIAPNDAQRIQRSLEIHEATGRSMTYWLDQPAPEIHERASFVRIALEPDRAALHARIAVRFREMVAKGLVDEVRALRARKDLCASLPAMRSIGYRQVWKWLDTDGSTATMIDTAVAATRQLAKRQLTWLRGMPDRIRIDPFATDAVEQASLALQSALSQAAGDRRDPAGSHAVQRARVVNRRGQP